MVARGLISFLVVGVGLFLLLVGYLKMSFYVVLPIAFLVSIMISPFLSKIKVAEKLWSKYERWLTKLFRLQ